MKKLILAVAAFGAVLAPAMASAQVQRAVATGGEAQLIQVADRRGDREWRRERREDRREHRRDRREDRREWRHDRRNYRQGYRDGYHGAPRYYQAPPRYYAPPPAYRYRPGYSYHQPRFYRGAVLPYEYRRYVVRDYYHYGWAPPPPGYAYYRSDTGEILLAAIATGVILSVIAGGF